jgi:IMP dehydrogenase
VSVDFSKKKKVPADNNCGHTFIGNYIKMHLPVFSSNMRHVTGVRMSVAMKLGGARGIQHRFKSIEESVQDYSDAIDGIWDAQDGAIGEDVGVSVGVNEESRKRFKALYDKGARLFCIDVAHSHHVLMKEMIYWIRENYNPDEITIIAGNVATPEGAFALHGWGADIIKVGIGPGAACTTRRNTGVGVPQFSALKDIMETALQDNVTLKIISDGGIKRIGDFSKAMIYADAVMVGKFLAGTSETPGKVYRGVDDMLYKVYGGSSSGENKVSTGQKKKYVEGIMQTVPFKGHVSHILQEIKDGMQSAFSYSGASNVDEFHSRVQWEVISVGAQRESKV